MGCRSTKINVTLDLSWEVYDSLLAEADARGVPLPVVIQETLEARSPGEDLAPEIESTAECRNILEGIIQALTTPLEEETAESYG